jgi:hypothetical protein
MMIRHPSLCCAVISCVVHLCVAVVEGIAAATQLTHLHCAWEERASLDPRPWGAEGDFSSILASKLPQLPRLQHLTLACSNISSDIQQAFCSVFAGMPQLRSLNLLKFWGLTAQDVKQYICRLTGLTQLGLQYDCSTEPSEEEDAWDNELQQFPAAAESVRALQRLADRMPELQSLELNADREFVDWDVLPVLQSPAWPQLQEVTLNFEAPPHYVNAKELRAAESLVQQVMAARAGLRVHLGLF